MKRTYYVEITDDLLSLFDNNGHVCDYHELQTLAAANHQLAQWHKGHKFNIAAARRDVLEFFRDCVEPDEHTILEQIAKKILHISTLASRNSDRLDFYEFSVEQIDSALRAAFNAGRESKS